MDETTMNTSESEDDLPKRKLLEPDKKLSFESMLSIRTDYRHRFQKILAKSFKKNDTISSGKCTTFYFIGLVDSRMFRFQSTIENFDRDNIWKIVETDNNLEFFHDYDCLIIFMDDVVSKELVGLACKAYRTYKSVAFVQMEDESTKKPIKKTYFNKNRGAYIEAKDYKTGNICGIPYFYVDLKCLMIVLESGTERGWHDEQFFVDFLRKVIENEKRCVDEKDEKFSSPSKSSTVIKNKLLDSFKCACEEKDELKFFQLINKDHVFFTVKDQSSNTILHIAAKNFDNSQIIEFILKKSHTLLWARNVEYETALMVSLEGNNFNATEVLLEKYADFNKELEVDEMMRLSDVANKHPEIQFLQKYYEDLMKKNREKLKTHIINRNQSLPVTYLSFENWRELFRRHSEDTESLIQLLITYLPKVAEMLFNKCKRQGDEEYLSELLNDSNDKTALMVFIEEENFEAAENLFNIYNKLQILLKENEKQMMLEAAIENPDIKFLQSFYHDKIISTEDYEEVLTKAKNKMNTTSDNAVNFAFIAESVSIVRRKNLMKAMASWDLTENFTVSGLRSNSISLEAFDCWIIFVSKNIKSSEIKLACKAKKTNKPVAFLQTNNYDKLLSERGENYFLTKNGNHHLVTLKDGSMETCEVPLFIVESTICMEAMLYQEDFGEFLKKNISFILDERILKEHDNLILSIKNKNSEQVIFYLNFLHWQKIFCIYPLDIQSPLQLLLMNMPETAEALFEKCIQEGDNEYLDELFNDFPANSNKNLLMHFIENQNFDCTKMLFEIYAKYKKQMIENEEKMILTVMDKNNDLKKIYEDLITKEHEYLKTSIENMKHNDVLSYFNSAHWQKLFCRHSSDIQSPVRLLLIHMPEIADKLFEKCVQEGEKEYLVELIDDYPTNSFFTEMSTDLSAGGGTQRQPEEANVKEKTTAELAKEKLQKKTYEYYEETKWDSIKCLYIPCSLFFVSKFYTYVFLSLNFVVFHYFNLCCKI